MSDPYSRVYHRMADEYPNVFDDCRALGTWLRLLVLADAAYPMTPTMPGGVDRKALSILAGAGLVTVDGTRYRIKGLVQERSRRSESARIGAYVRHANAERPHSDTSANAVQTHSGRSANDMPRLDETSRDKTRVNGTVKEGAGARGLRPVDPVGEAS